MKKKMIALTLIFAMLVPLSPAVAADEPSSQPTIEEILNGYHEKAFAAQIAEENASVSTYSRRSGSEKDLAEETVDELTAAGYEAYNVTSDNYEELEASLQTDFASMGLDPEGSYIVVISGEDNSESSPSSNARVVDPPHYDYGDEGVGSPNFTYTYNGSTYYMRCVLVTGADSLIDSGVYAVQDADRLSYILENLFSTILVAIADGACEIPFGTIASLLLDNPDDYVYANLEVDSFAIHSRSEWTCEYIQVWNSYDSEWVTSQMSEYVYTSAYCAGYVTDTATGRGVPCITEECVAIIYSNYYTDMEKRKADAMEAYDNPYDTIYFDAVEYISFSLGNEEGEILFNSQNQPLFQHYRGTALVLPD